MVAATTERAAFGGMIVQTTLLFGCCAKRIGATLAAEVGQLNNGTP
jgi:hypothetical protein